MEKLPIGKRIALKVLLPLAHSCVSNREATKSILIRFYFCWNFFQCIFCFRTVDQFRKAYSYLAETMVQSGFLSEPGLIWFLTHHEIGQSLQATGYDTEQTVRHYIHWLYFYCSASTEANCWEKRRGGNFFFQFGINSSFQKSSPAIQFRLRR